MFQFDINSEIKEVEDDKSIPYLKLNVIDIK